MSDNKLKVGQTVWFSEVDRRTGKGSIKETTIEKVGRMYFFVKCSRNKFSIESLKVVSDTNVAEYIYADIEDFNRKEKYKNLLSKMRLFFGHYGKIDITLEQLEGIEKILSIPE